jgi:predicted RND superfamily exporter protein
VRIELHNDLVELLPDHMPEVKVIREVLYESGGLGYQTVMVSSKDRKLNQAFLQALRFRLSSSFRAPDALPFADAMQDQYGRIGALLRDIGHYGRNPSTYAAHQLNQRIGSLSRAPFVEYSFAGYDLSFFRRHQLYMLSIADLQTIHKRLAKKIKYEVKKRQLGQMNLLDPGERQKDPGIDLRDIHKKYASKMNAYPRRIEVKEKGLWHAALIIRPRGVSTDIIFTKAFINALKRSVASLKKDTKWAGVTVDYTGNFSNNLREFHGISKDLQSSIASTVALLLLLLFVFFRRFRMLWIISIPLGIGFVWTFAFAYLAIGHLNTATSFIGVLLLGLGIDYGIYLAHRYYVERQAGKSVEQAIADCYFWTGKSVATAAITTAVGFFALMLCRFRGFSEFGLIAGMGIILCLTAMSTAMPALLVLWEGWRPKEPSKPLFVLPAKSRAFPIPMVFVLVALVVIVAAVMHIPKVPFESNMSRLSFKSGGMIDEAKKWKKFDKLFPAGGMNPVVFYVKTEGEARFLMRELDKRQAKERKDHPNRPQWSRAIRQVMAAFAFVPEKQKEKQRILKKIKHLLDKNGVEDWAEDDPKLGKVYDDYAPLLAASPFTATHLPLYLQRDLVMYDKDRYEKVAGYMVAVLSGFDLSDGLQVARLHKRIKGFYYKSGNKQTRQLAASGEPIIFSELLQVIDEDSLRAILWALLAVLLLVLIDLRSIKLTLLSLWPLATGLLGVSILLVFFDVRLNMFNMVVLPALLGINVDAGVHMLHRYREEPELGTLGVEFDLLGAITVASLTTVISFASLILAHHQGMQSVGRLALVGLASGLIGSFVFLPALMEVIFRSFPLKRHLHKD